MTKSTLTVAQLQLPVSPDPQVCLAQMQAGCAQAAGLGADIIALPEMFCCPYGVEHFPAYAQAEGGPVWAACAQTAARLGVWLSAGSVPELAADGRLYNTAYVFDRSGRQAAKHRKVHLFDIDVAGGQHFQESAVLSAGEQITTFETEWCTFGLCICYDFRFPEMGRLMALAGAEIILVPAAFNLTTGPAHWALMFRSQSVNNQVFSIGTAPARDTGADYVSWGHSIISDPWGKVLSQMGPEAGLQLTTLDLTQITAVRSQLPLLRQRRTDLYTLQERAGSVRSTGL